MSKGAIRFPSQTDPLNLKTENGRSDMGLPHMDSSLANLSILARKSMPPVRPNVRLALARYGGSGQEYDDFEEQLKQCHQDGDYSECCFFDLMQRHKIKLGA